MRRFHRVRSTAESESVDAPVDGTLDLRRLLGLFLLLYFQL